MLADSEIIRQTVKENMKNEVDLVGEDKLDEAINDASGGKTVKIGGGHALDLDLTIKLLVGSVALTRELIALYREIVKNKGKPPKDGSELASEFGAEKKNKLAGELRGKTDMIAQSVIDKMRSGI